MAAPNLAQNWKSKVAGAVMLGVASTAALTGSANNVMAQETVSEATTAAFDAEKTPLLHAAQQSIEYSKETGGVGIVMTYGAWDGAPSAEEIGERFVQLFNEKGADASFFVVESDTPGVAVTFTAYDTGIGPYSPNDAVNAIPDAIAQNNTARNLVFSQLDF